MLLQTMGEGHVLREGPQSIGDPLKNVQCEHQPDAFLHGGPEAEGLPDGLEVHEGLSSLVPGHQQPGEQHLAPAPQCLLGVVLSFLGSLRNTSFLEFRDKT